MMMVTLALRVMRLRNVIIESLMRELRSKHKMAEIMFGKGLIFMDLLPLHLQLHRPWLHHISNKAVLKITSQKRSQKRKLVIATSNHVRLRLAEMTQLVAVEGEVIIMIKLLREDAEEDKITAVDGVEWSLSRIMSKQRKMPQLLQ